MNIVDFVIIYLALGAPFAVYKYLQDPRLSLSRKLTVAVVTLIFWVPVAVRVGYRRLTNAYSGDDFVSHDDLDARNGLLAELADRIRFGLRTTNSSITPHSTREVLDRYVGLSVLSEAAALDVAEIESGILHAAGRADDRVAAACLLRRNQQRIERHQRKARQDFLALFENVESGGLAAADRVIASAMQLAKALDDRKALNGLEAIKAQVKDDICDPMDQPSVLSNISTTVSPLAIETASLKND